MNDFQVVAEYNYKRFKIDINQYNFIEPSIIFLKKVFFNCSVPKLRATTLMITILRRITINMLSIP